MNNKLMSCRHLWQEANTIFFTALILLFPSCSKDFDDDTAYTPNVEFKAESYMSLNPESGSVQGAACYDDYFVQGYAPSKYFTIYNLKEKNRIGTVNIPASQINSTIHCNTLNFGNQKYDDSDFYPILYVSSGYRINGNTKIYAYRIKCDDPDDIQSYSVVLVQTIILDGFGTWTEGILDNENNYLWIKYEPEGTNGPYGYAKYEIPDVHQGDVTIDQGSYLDNFSLNLQPSGSSNQCHLYYHDLIILVSGVPARSQSLAFIVINTISHNEEMLVNLRKAGLNDEPEGLIRYDGHFMIGYSKKLYKFLIDAI